MANEGSTKPTYSELETDLTAATSNMETYEQDNVRLRAENVRVRGLLQRATVLLAESQESIGGMWRDRRDRFVKDAGAESADIGKLDTADKKLNECNRHDDCAAAEAAVLARHPGKTISLTFHCYDDECEDCFGQ